MDRAPLCSLQPLRLDGVLQTPLLPLVFLCTNTGFILPHLSTPALPLFPSSLSLAKINFSFIESDIEFKFSFIFFPLEVRSEVLYPVCMELVNQVKVL